MSPLVDGSCRGAHQKEGSAALAHDDQSIQHGPLPRPERRRGHEVSAEELADMMLQLQHRGCHNINFVAPSHVVAQILEAPVIAAAHGRRPPLVYNTGGYDSQEALALLDGVIDIYLPHTKYGALGDATGRVR